MQGVGLAIPVEGSQGMNQRDAVEVRHALDASPAEDQHAGQFCLVLQLYMLRAVSIRA